MSNGIEQLQAVEQSLQHLLVQRRSLVDEQEELSNTLSHLKGSKQAFQTIGNIMVQRDVSALQVELEKQKEHLAQRVEALAKQEQQLTEKKKALQQEILSQG